MGELREIVEVEAVSRVFMWLALLLPVLGILLGAAIGARRNHLRRGVFLGFLVGLFGPLNLLLWRVYNLLTDRNGLDTVRNLVINVVLFVVVGVVIGVLIGMALRPRPQAEELPPTPEVKPKQTG